VFSYNQVVSALMKVNSVTPPIEGIFIGRLNSLKRLGVVPSSPGKGKKIDYTIKDFIEWALCFEFIELGLTPENVKAIIKSVGFPLYTHFEGPVQDDPIFIFIEGNFLEWRVDNFGSPNFGDDARGSYLTASLSNFSPEFFRKYYLGRHLMLNLTGLKVRIGRALGISWNDVRVDIDESGTILMSQPVLHGEAGSK